MKNNNCIAFFRSLFFTSLIFSVLIISCTNDSSAISETETSVSTSFRFALNSMLSKFVNAAKQAVATNYESLEDSVEDLEVLCFDFVYPITLSYNNGETVVVNSLDEIVELLQSENNNYYLNGIAFPFQVVYFAQNLIVTVANENGFETLNLSCGDNYFDENDFDADSCYEFVYPISFINAANEILEVENLNTLNNLSANDSNAPVLNLVYPVSMVFNGKTVVIQNFYQFVEIVNSCDKVVNPTNLNDDFTALAHQRLIQFVF